ncbi:MAG TPA: DsbA family protein [Croceicoccus sp.]|nr:DsbA family protein [Croceicoccus sp.]
MTYAVKPLRIAAAVVFLVVLALGAAWIVSARGAEPESAADNAVRDAGFDAKERVAIEAVVRDYLLKHPEILPEIVEKLREKETAAAMDGIQEKVATPYRGAVLGNPEGSTVLVEFSDYACGYCRRSVAEVDALIAENPDLKVVIREFPILSQDSVEAAKWALAAAEQGKYEAFHRAMYDEGRPSPDAIARVAKAVGLDMAAAQKAIASDAVRAEIEANRAYASQLQFDGTPAWVIGNTTLQGALAKSQLAEALEKSGQGG